MSHAAHAHPTAKHHTSDGIILAIACVAQFMVVLDVSIVNVALPFIQPQLHFSDAGIQWVVNAYVLTFAGFLLLGGRAADLFGRRRIYLLGIAVFTLASVGAGLAQTSGQLVAARAIQGLGGAILSPATLTIIVTTFQGPRLPKAIGAWSAVAGGGGAAGSLLGGILVGELNWRWVFFINLPIGIAAGVAALVYLHELRGQETTSKLDITGAVLITSGLAALVYGIVHSSTAVLNKNCIQVGTIGWGASSTLEWLLAGAVLIVAFVFWETKVATKPLVPFRIFKSRSMTGADLTMLMIGAAFFSMWFFLAFYLNNILGFDALKTGFGFAPMAIAIVVGAQISSRILTKTGVRPLIFAGTILATLGFLWLSLIKVDSSYWSAVLLPGCTVAFAIGILFTPLATAATAEIDRSEAGLASGVLNTGRQVGGSLGLAILAAIATSVTTSYVSSHASRAHGVTSACHATHLQLTALAKAAQTAGYQRAFELSAVVTMLAFVASWIIPARTGLQSSSSPAAPAIID